jgi:glycine cleavage system transcriptional repressor
MRQRTICLTVLGRERPGIVAGITGVLYDTDCNIRDSTMTILAGEFAMLLIVVLPEDLTGQGLERALGDVQRRFELTIFIKPLLEEEVFYQPAPLSRTWAVTIYGGDRKGIVHAVASVMARKSISILTLKTKVISDLEGAGIVTMRVLAPPDVELEGVRRQLNDVATRFGIEVSIG